MIETKKLLITKNIQTRPHTLKLKHFVLDICFTWDSVFGVWKSVFGVWDSGVFGVWDSAFGVWDTVFGAWNSVWDSVFGTAQCSAGLGVRVGDGKTELKSVFVIL